MDTLDAALFAGAATVVRHRGHVLDGGDFQPDGLESADGRLAARTGAFNPHFEFAHAVRHGLPGGVLRDLLSRVGGALARALESNAAGAGPADDVSLHVGDAYEGVVECSQNGGDAA